MSMNAQEITPFIQLQWLQTKVASLEDQLNQTIAFSKKKEALANTLATDLEHIIGQLQRLEVVR